MLWERADDVVHHMKYVANITKANIDIAGYAAELEASGWDGMAIADHSVHSGRLWPHVWVGVGAAAAATERIVIATAFVNNLFRNPVEFAQAALGVQRVSSGRFEAGLGAGWAEAELVAMGMDYPSPGERVERFVEALTICRALFDDGACHFDGQHYQVHIDDFTTDHAPPPLVGALGGPRILREAGPLLDRIEVKAAGVATRGGDLDFARLGEVTVDDVKRQIERARDANADAPLSFFGLCAAAPGASSLVESFPDASMYKPFFGEPAQVVEAIESLAELGFDQVTVSAFDPAHFGPIAQARSEL